MYLYLIILALVAFLSYLKLIKPHQHWKNKGIDYIEPTFLFGNFGQSVLQKIPFCSLVENLYSHFPNHKYFGIFRFSQPILLLKDPELIKQIGIKDFDNFSDHPTIVSEDIDPLWGKNLFASTGKRWRHMRPILSPSFTSSKMKAMFALVSDCADQFINHFSEKNEEICTVEMKDVFTRYTNDVIATCAFGIHCNSLEEQENEFYLFGKDATNFGGLRSLKFFLNALSPFLCKLFDVKIFSSKTAAFFRNLTQSTVKMREEQGIVRPDMIHLLMEARKGKVQNDDNKIVDTGFATVEESDIGKVAVARESEITDDDITAQALIFFLAGFDTAATLMAYITYELAVNKDIQDKLIEEVDETLKECNGKLTYDALHKMKYLDMIVSETLRKWPPSAATDRLCKNDYTLDRENSNQAPLIIEKDTLVWFPIFALHRDPKYFPDPEKFDPERFSDENKGNIHPSTYIPFGIGPRNCIGSRFALMENKAVIFHILTKFEIVPVEKSVIPVVLSPKGFNMDALNGIWLGFKKRNL